MATTRVLGGGGWSEGWAAINKIHQAAEHLYNTQLRYILLQTINHTGIVRRYPGRSETRLSGAVHGVRRRYKIYNTPDDEAFAVFFFLFLISSLSLSLFLYEQISYINVTVFDLKVFRPRKSSVFINIYFFCTLWRRISRVREC